MSENVRQAILDALAAQSPGRSVDPTAVARSIAGSDERLWSRLMGPIRTEAVRLAEEGQLVIVRKNRPVDPRAFKGVYRLRSPDSPSEG